MCIFNLVVNGCDKDGIVGKYFGEEMVVDDLWKILIESKNIINLFFIWGRNN